MLLLTQCAPLRVRGCFFRIVVGARIARPQLVDISKFGLNSKIKKFSDFFICGKGYSPPSGGENSFLSTVWGHALHVRYKNLRKIRICSFTEKIKPRNAQTEKFSTFKDKLWKKTDAAKQRRWWKAQKTQFSAGVGAEPQRIYFSVMIFFRSAIELFISEEVSSILVTLSQELMIVE